MFASFMQEHTVQHLACCRAETKADIGETKCGVRARNFGFDSLDGFQSCDAVFAQVFVAGANWEGQGIKDEVACVKPVSLSGNVVKSVCNFHLPFHIACLATFVNEQANNSCAIVARKREHAVKATAWLFTIFKVG